MKEIKLTIDGKEVQLTAEQIKSLGIDVDDGCVCDRVNVGKPYYYITSYGAVCDTTEFGSHIDDETFDYGDYYRSKPYTKQIAMHQHLNNLLRRYSEQHGGDKEWDYQNPHYDIIYNSSKGAFFICELFCDKRLVDVYFNSREIAQYAIDEVVKPFMAEHPDFVW